MGGGEDVEVTATVQRTGLQVGTFTDQFILSSNSEEGNKEIGVTLEVPELTIMTITETSIEYGFFENEKSFLVKNDGNVEFNWDWDDNSNSFVSVNPNSGTLNTGESIEVTMTIDRTDLLSGTYDIEVFFSNDKDQITGLTIQIDHFKEEKWIIHGSVIDAEYDRNNDVLVVVSENPNELRVFDLTTNTVESVALNLPPTSLSVGLNGMHAAVGHNGSFSYVNLSTMALENNYSVTADVFDIILAPNNWVYVFPRGNQWERIRCINLANGAETLLNNGLIYERTRAQLHPSGDYIYGATNGLAPSDFEKYDIRGGTVQYLYDSPYHGDFSFSGDLWISDDGNRLFAKSRNVFISSTNQNTDMTYSGQLSGGSNVITLDHSSAAQMVYAILNTGSSWNERPDNQIRMYETQFLAFQGTIELPGFLIPDGSGGGNFYDSEGHFGFFDSNGTQFHVLVKAQAGSGASNEWAIVSVDVE